MGVGVGQARVGGMEGLVTKRGRDRELKGSVIVAMGAFSSFCGSHGISWFNSAGVHTTLLWCVGRSDRKTQISAHPWPQPHTHFLAGTP